VVRSDKNLDSSIVRSEAWESDEFTGNSGGKVDRYLLPEGMQARMSFSGSERNSVFINSLAGTFANVSGVSGLDSASDGRCVAIIDYDKDGRNDFMITNTNKPTLGVYRNNLASFGQSNHFIAVQVEGGNRTSQPSSEFASRDGIGAIVRVQTASQNLMRGVHCGDGLATQGSRTQLFGLGSAEVANRVEVLWPSGKKMVANDVPSGSLVLIRENPTSDTEPVEIKDYSTTPELDDASPTISRTKTSTFPVAIDELETGKLNVCFAMATWCENCRSHLPDFELIKNELGEQVKLLAIPVDEKDRKEKLDDYVEKHNVKYQLAEIKNDVRQQFTKYAADKLGSAPMPFAVILSENGKVLRVMHGIPSLSDLKKLLNNSN